MTFLGPFFFFANIIQRHSEEGNQGGGSPHAFFRRHVWRSECRVWGHRQVKNLIFAAVMDIRSHPSADWIQFVSAVQHQHVREAVRCLGATFGDQRVSVRAGHGAVNLANQLHVVEQGVEGVEVREAHHMGGAASCGLRGRPKTRHLSTDQKFRGHQVNHTRV